MFKIVVVMMWLGIVFIVLDFFFFSSRRRHTRFDCDWSSDVCSSDLGPIATPDDAAYILQACRSCHGFYGASSMERLPAETALTETARTFKRIGIKRKENAS